MTGTNWLPYPINKPSNDGRYYLVTYQYPNEARYVKTAEWLGESDLQIFCSEDENEAGMIDDFVLAFACVPDPYQGENS